VGSPVPAPSYPYTVFPAANVADFVGNTSCGAGATLQITSDGVISSSCGSTGITDPVAASKVTLFPTEVDNTLNVSIQNSDNITSEITVFTVGGQKVFATSTSVSSGQPVELNVSTLQPGIYFCRVSNNSQSDTLKFIKK